MALKVFLSGFVFCLFNLIISIKGDHSDIIITIHVVCMLINYILLLNEILT